MAVAAKIDQMDTLEMQEKWGVITAVKRKALVTGLSGTTLETFYGALDAAGVPAWGDYLDLSRCAHLALTDRNVKIIDKDKAEVELVYGSFNDRGQHLFYPSGYLANRPVSGKMQASVTQVKTNLYREGGTGAQQLITVQHTYPATDSDYANKTIIQTGTADVYAPQSTFTIEGVKTTTAPWNIAEALLSAVNDDKWLGKDKHTWMCTEVTWDFRTDTSYFMTFTFQHNPDTWNPTVVFVDDRTDKPPLGLVEGVGYKYLRYHREVNFVRELGFFIIGPSQTLT